MAYLIDAFNVMHRAPGLARRLRAEGPAAAGDALVDALAAWLAAERAAAGARPARPKRRRGPPEVVLVFDGPRPAGRARAPAPGLTVLHLHDEADAELKKRLEREPGRHVLVSADAEIVAVARRTGSEVLAPDLFLARVDEARRAAAARDERERMPDEAEVEAWRRLFEAAPDVDPPRRRPPPRA